MIKNKPLLAFLDKNSRAKVTKISSAIKQNATTIHYNIKKLADEGKISFYPIINLPKLGLISFRIYLSFKNTNFEQEKEIESFLKNNDQVTVLAKCLSNYDLMISVVVKSIYEFQKFWKSFKEKYAKYIQKETISIFTEVTKYTRGYLNSKKESFRLKNSEVKELTELQEKILFLLSKNARSSSVQIAGKLDAEARTVALNIKNLEKKNIILGYGLNIDLQLFDYQYYKINVKLDDYENYNKLLEIAENHPNVVFYNKTIGFFDFEIDIEVENQKMLEKILFLIKESAKIKEIEIISFKEYLKFDVLPKLKRIKIIKEKMK